MPPRFSVIVPLIEHRGVARESIATWQRQTIPRSDFEMIAVTRGEEPDVERQIADLLGPDDRILSEPGANRSRLYDLGARAARGEILLFTESHCFAAPNCLAELDRFLLTHPDAGVCCHSVGIASGFRDREDLAMFEEGFRLFVREGDWRKVNVHGFALRRQVYLEVGGLPHRYAGFAEMLLAAALRDRGHRLGYADRAEVRHEYRASFRDNADLVDFFLAGESLYRAEHPGPDAVGYTFLPADLRALPSRQGRLWLALAAALLRDLLLRAMWRCDTATLGSLKQALPRSLGLPAWLGDRFGAASGEWLARCRYGFWFWHPRRRAAAYRDWFDRVYRRCRVRFLLRHAPEASTPRSLERIDIEDIAEEDRIGFHDRESYNGRAFRWTGRACIVRLDLPPLDAEIRLETNNLRQEPVPLDLRVFANGRLVPPDSVRVEPGGIRFPLRVGRLRTLALTCRPVEPWKNGIPDRRELGLPLFAIEIRPIQ